MPQMKSVAEKIVKDTPSEFNLMARIHLRDEIEAALQDAFAAGRASAVPEGWQLVPKVITRGMRRVYRNDWPTKDFEQHAMCNWYAMLAAAPQPKEK